MGAGNWVTPAMLDGSFGSDPNAEEAIAMASHILWSFSGRKYSKVRTVAETYECACRSLDRRVYPWTWVPVMDHGSIYNVSAADLRAAALTGACACKGSARKTRLRLRGTPVRGVQAVRRGSTVIDPGTYRVENSGILTLDSVAPGSACGLTVEYNYGTGVPSAGMIAGKLLAQEFLRSWSGDDDCRLPDRVTNVSRQGVSFTVLDRQEFLDDLRTGIYEVDLFLRATNPDRARNKAKVFSPDVPRAYRVTSGSGYQDLEDTTDDRYDLYIRQGAAFVRLFSRSIDGTPVTMADWSFAAQIRGSESAQSPLLLDLGPYLSLYAGHPDTVELRIPAGVTAGLSPFPAGAAWDIFTWPTDSPEESELWLQGRAVLDVAATEVPA